jgi:uncharacterized protein (TIGR02996 family)
VSALAKSANVEQLTHLDLGSNRITDEAVTALASSPRLARLQGLNLVGNAITDPGGRALAESPHLTALRHLNLAGCAFTREVRRALVARYGEGAKVTGDTEPDAEAQARRPFLEAIAKRPEENEPRLAFADWLEASDPERAEFIRVQCELVRLGENHPRREELRDREQELLADNLRRWSRELPELPGVRWDWLGDWETIRTAFDRGLFQRVGFELGEQFREQREEVFGTTVIRDLSASGAADLRAVAELPCLRQLRSLQVRGNDLSPCWAGFWPGCAS